MNIALYEPEIPPNTGNIIRLSANTGAQLHLIGKLGFSMDDRHMRRAGLDYHQYASVKHHQSFDAFMTSAGIGTLYACSTRGSRCFSDVSFTMDDTFLFGSETSGLPDHILNHKRVDERITIPMKNNSRSLNLANAVSIILYEAWRQNGFK